MKRSRREGRWADIPSAWARFVLEAAFLMLVALGAALMELSPLMIVLLMACAWILVALVERASSREPAREASTAAEEDGLQAERVQELEPREAYRWLFWRRARAPAEELPSPTAPLEERPARSHVRRIEPELETSSPAQQPEPAEEASARIEAPPRGPVVTKRALDLRGLEQPPAPVPSPPARPRRSLTRAARRVVPPAPAVPPPPPPAPPPREWNLWDLERRAREQAGSSPHTEEWSALFTHLRVFANADGLLPKEFDELVRESFGELIEAA